jgi:DNA-binding CsgD family transcriptional regulator
VGKSTRHLRRYRQFSAVLSSEGASTEDSVNDREAPSRTLVEHLEDAKLKLRAKNRAHLIQLALSSTRVIH